MANKDALRDLQTRLASRLQAAKTQPRARGWLAVECAGVGLLLPLGQAGEIFPLRALLKLPHAKPWMTRRGATARRPVRRDRPGGLPGPACAEGQRRRGARRPARDAGAVAAGQLPRCASTAWSGLRGEEQLTREAESAESVGARPAFAAGRWKDAQGASWQEIDLGALAVDGAFLDVMS